MHQHNSTRPSRLGARLAAGFTAGAVAIAGLVLAPTAAQAGPAPAWASSIGFVGAYDIDVTGGSVYAASRERGLYRSTPQGVITTITDDRRTYMGIAVAENGDLYYTLDSNRTIYRIPADALSSADPVSAATPYITLPFTTPVFTALAFDQQGRLYGAGGVYDSYDGVWTSETSILRIGADATTTEIFRGSPRNDLAAFDFTADGDALLVNSWDGTLQRLKGASSRVSAATMSDLVATGLQPGSAQGLAVVDSSRVYVGTRLLDITPRVSAGAPVVSGDRSVGGVLTAEAGEWTPGTTFTYRWLRDGVAIAGATASTYRLTADDRGTAITVEVTGSAIGHSDATAVSASAGTVLTGQLTPGSPVVSGDLIVGSALTGTSGTWASGVALRFQWLREKTPIDGATESSYTLTAADEGFTIALAVTGSLEGYNDETVRVRTLAPVVAAPVVVPPVVVPPVVTPPVVAPPVVATPTTAPAISIDGVVEVGGTIAGSSITVRGSGLAASSAWSVWLRSTPVLLASGFADGDGAFERTVVLPSSIEQGAHRLIVSGVDANGAAVESIVYVTVRADGTLGYSSTVQAQPAATVPALPSTGAEASGAMLALALLLGGLALVVLRRRSA